MNRTLVSIHYLRTQESTGLFEYFVTPDLNETAGLSSREMKGYLIRNDFTGPVFRTNT